ncbi:MAG: hypothetical protein AABZ47_06800, partial [Planctomycetota bacterium]
VSSTKGTLKCHVLALFEWRVDLVISQFGDLVIEMAKDGGSEASPFRLFDIIAPPPRNEVGHPSARAPASPAVKPMSGR